MDKVNKKLLKAALSRVNATLKYYEADWISAQRAPEIERVRVTSFEEFVEIRVNNELSKIPDLHYQILKTDGHMFVCTGLDDINDVRHRFKLAHISVISPDEFPDENKEELCEIINSVKSWLGGEKFTFNSVVERVKITIIEE
jgi:hypothetical protein